MKISRSKLIWSVCFSLIFILGWLCKSLYDTYREARYQPVQVREDTSKYPLIHPLLYVDNSNINFPQLNSLKENLQEYISDAQNNPDIEKISVYYRDLNSSEWTGVNEDEKYIPGSILKVPDLIVYLKLAEDDQEILNKSLYYDKTKNEGQYYAPGEQLENGYYKINVLLGHAIVESDNAAHYALSLPVEKELNSYYKALRIPIPVTGNETDFRTPRDISLIFRSLYGSTYLSDSYSEQAMELLSRTSFTKGLVAGVDKGTIVAHKFGEHSVYSLDPAETPKRQLHDCGIVYQAKGPYFICVMTKGNDFAKLEKVISDISRITFEFVKRK